MYIKKKDRELYSYLDEKLELPNKWNKFVKEQSVKHNFIIKNKNNYHCTYCKYEFTANKKVNEECKCPNCKNTYIVKSNRLKHYIFKDYLAIFDKVDDYSIERLFQLESYYSEDKIDSVCFEWGRNVFDKDLYIQHQIINNNTVATTSGIWISYKSVLDSHWHISDSYSNPIRYIEEFIYYPYNIKKLLGKIEKYKYSQLWTLLKHINYCNLFYLLDNYNYSIELLTKLKLYNLALCPKSFKNKTFDKNFYGLTKDYLPFMQKYNIDLTELEILSIVKKKDINLIREIKNKTTNYFNLARVIDLTKAVKLTDLNEDNQNEYADYLNMIDILDYNLTDNKILYPENIEIAHDKVLTQYKIKEDENINKAIIKRYKKLEKNTFKNKKFIIKPAQNYKSLEDESYQQHNCVKTYAERIAYGECDIYFMRLLSEPKKSLVTVEVRRKQVVQQRTKFNNNTTKEQKKFLEIWEKEVLSKS